MYYLQGHRVKNVGTHCKILPLEILMWKITSTSTYSSKVISKVKVFNNIGQIPRSMPKNVYILKLEIQM